MICEHLIPVEEKVISKGAAETFRGQPWSKVTGEWVYYDCYLMPEELIASLSLPGFVIRHEHRGTHDGSELGLVCEKCDCGIMGLHPSSGKDGVPGIGLATEDKR